MSEVESNCRYTDFYLDGLPVHQHQYPDHAQCVEMGIQAEGCNSLRASRPNGSASSAPITETVVVVGSSPAAPLSPSPVIIHVSPSSVGDVSLPTVSSVKPDKQRLGSCLASAEKDAHGESVRAAQAQLTDIRKCNSITSGGYLEIQLSWGPVSFTAGSSKDTLVTICLAEAGAHYEFQKAIIADLQRERNAACKQRFGN